MTACPKTPPAKHRRSGAVLRSDYAYPECWKYPIHTPEQVRAAASYFARFKNKVPAAQRSKVAARIEAAKRRFGIGPYRENPDEAMMSKKDAKIRGHQMALANAQKRGDKAGVAKQRAALAKLGGSAPRGSGKSATRHKGKANPAPRKGVSSMRGGKRYRHNPAANDNEALDAAEEKVAAVKEAVQEQKAEVKAEKAEVKAEKSSEAKKRLTAAERKLRDLEKKLAKANERVKRDAERIAKKADAEAKKARDKAVYESDYAYGSGSSAPAKKSTRKATKGRKESTMAKRTKEEQKKITAKAKRTRARNKKLAEAGKKPAKKSAKRKAAKKSTARKSSSRRHSRFPKVPKGFRRVKSRVSIAAKSRKTGKRRTFTKTRAYKSNPMSNMGQLAVMGGGVLVGAILSDLLRRYVVTMPGKGGKEPFYGNMANERISDAHPTGMAYAAQGLLGAAGLGLAYAVRKKSPGAATFLAGLGIGSLVQMGLELFVYGVAPALMKADNVNSKKPGNRLYPLQQKYAQDYVASIIKTENDSIAAGTVYKPDGGTAGLPRRNGVAGLPQGQQPRQLPPAQGTAFRPAQAANRGGQVAGTPQQTQQARTGQVGCGGGGCGQGGCTGGRNCGCASCQGLTQSEAVAPAAMLDTATTAQMPSRDGNVAGPRQLAAPRNVVSFMPRQTGHRALMMGR